MDMLHIRVDKNLHEKIKAEAKKDGRSITSFVVNIIKKTIENK